MVNIILPTEGSDLKQTSGSCALSRLTLLYGEERAGWGARVDLQAGMHMPGPQWQRGRLREVGRLEGCLGKSQGHLLMDLGWGGGAARESLGNWDCEEICI